MRFFSPEYTGADRDRGGTKLIGMWWHLAHYAKSAIYYASPTTRLSPDFPGLKQRRIDLGHRLGEFGTQFEKQNDAARG